jgi:hypothetical protein
MKFVFHRLIGLLLETMPVGNYIAVCRIHDQNNREKNTVDLVIDFFSNIAVEKLNTYQKNAL